MPTPEFTIGQLSRRTGCKIPTIRYYEQIGLLPESRRSPGNQRIYDSGHLARLTFIRQCRELGFPQPAVRDLLHFTEHPDRSCDAVARIARVQLEEVDRRIARLSSLRRELQRIVKSCSGGPVATCKIIEALAAEGGSQSHAQAPQRRNRN
jgi:DNA-binding transcriptional MerR regulator